MRGFFLKPLQPVEKVQSWLGFFDRLRPQTFRFGACSCIFWPASCYVSLGWNLVFGHLLLEKRLVHSKLLSIWIHSTGLPRVQTT